MSFAIELFLKQIVQKQKLPFALFDELDQANVEQEKFKRARAEEVFWKSFMMWYFKIWPHFDSSKMAALARDTFENPERQAGAEVYEYLSDACKDADKGSLEHEEALDALDAYYELNRLCSRPKSWSTSPWDPDNRVIAMAPWNNLLTSA